MIHPEFFPILQILDGTTDNQFNLLEPKSIQIFFLAEKEKNSFINAVSAAWEKVFEVSYQYYIYDFICHTSYYVSRSVNWSFRGLNAGVAFFITAPAYSYLTWVAMYSALFKLKQNCPLSNLSGRFCTTSSVPPS